MSALRSLRAARVMRSRALILLSVLLTLVGTVEAVAWRRAAAHADVPHAAPAQSAVPVTSRPDLVSARLAAKSQGSRVRISSLDDAYSSTYVNSDGTLTTEQSLTPVRVQQADGSWADVNYDLQHVDGGWSPKVSPAPVVFSDGADTDAASIGSGGKQVALSWAVTLPKPTIDGPTATYDLGGGESLVLTATADGFEQSLVLANAPTSLPQIKLPFDTSDLTLSADAADGYKFTNSDGKTVYSIPAPSMYDSSIDPVTGSPRTQQVATKLVSTTDGPRLDLAPAMSFLTDPATAYPVTIDPQVMFGAGAGGSDTFVEDDLTSAQGNASQLRVGETSTGHAARTYMSFGTLNALNNKHILSATLKLWNNKANTCTAASVYAYPLTSTWSNTGTTWSNKPSPNTSSAYSTSSSFAYGTTGCNPAWVTFNIKNMVAAWANNTIARDGLQLSGHEASGAQFWGLCSVNWDPNANTSCNVSTHTPSLTVTYNSIPGTATGQQIAPSATSGSTLLTNSATPQLSAVVSDADGGPMTYNYEVATSASSANDVATGSVSGTAGTRATWTVPAGKLSDGGTYYWRVYGNDGTDSGAASGWQQFTVDTTPPPAPSVSSTDWPSGSWTAATTGTISWSATGAASFQYQVDKQPDWTTTTDSSKSFTLGTNEQHTVKLQALDAAGNVSGTTSYTFGIGNGALTSPADGVSSAKYFALTAAAQPSTPWVSYQWRLGGTGNFSSIPAGDVTGLGTGSAAPSSWPWVASNAASYVWNAAHTITGDGDVQLEVCFATDSSGSGSTCQTDPTDVQLSSGSFSGALATKDLGPGSVSLVTGDFSISATDANIEASNTTVSLSRSFESLHPAAASNTAQGVFGPGWTASLDGPEGGAAGSKVATAPDNSYVTLTSADGSEDTYVATSKLTSNPITYAGLGDADDGSVITYDTSAKAVTLTDANGTRTSWGYSVGQWQPVSVVQTGDAAQNTSSYYFDTSSSSPTFGLPTRIVAPSPVGVDCSTQAKAESTQGCRSLTFTYSAVAAGGSTVQRLTGVSLRAWNPQASTPMMQTIAIEAYDYDSTGHLADEWDPRISPALKTTYTYYVTGDPSSDGPCHDTAQLGRICSVAPPGLAAWTMHYDSAGRLSSVTRPDPSGATATTTVVYDVPISGSNAPIDLSYGSVASWGQYADIPVTGTAVFDPDHVPASTSLADLTSNKDWPYADLTYVDYLGNPTNTASYGAGDWQIDSSMYDANSNVFWQLTAGNRAQALSPTTATDPWIAAQNSSATRATYLSTYRIYNADNDLAIQAGPMHPVALPDGTVTDARDAKYLTYNAGAPSGETLDLQTGEADYAYGADGKNYDIRNSSMGYDPIDGASSTGATSGWTLGSPTVRTDAGNLVTKTRFNSADQTVEQRLPGDPNGTGPRTTLSTYYTSTGSGACVNAAFAGLLCQTAPSAQPSSGKPLAVVTYSYDMYGDVITKTETYGSGTGQVIRTTNYGYDSAQRLTSRSVTVTPSSAGGTPIPAVALSYDTATGLGTSLSTANGGVNASITAAYDSLGQRTSYTDASGTKSTTTYDLDGRTASQNDGKGTTTFTYDSSSEHRGYITREDIGVSGSPSSVVVTYNADGDVSNKVFPNGLTATATYDNTQSATNLSYAKDGTTWMTFSQMRNTHAEVMTQSSPESTQTFSHDSSGRLTSVQDTDNGSCATRIYTLDNDSNRVKFDTYPAADDGSCTTATAAASQAATFDQADRNTNSGYGYDSLGRTLTVPATDAIGVGAHASASGALSLSFAANDMVVGETQGSASENYTLDPQQDRILTSSDGTTVSTNHYDDSTDSPAWTSTSSSTWTRMITGPDGALIASSDQSNAVTLELTNLHDDVVATVPNSTAVTAGGISQYAETTEFGAGRSTATISPYGYLGGVQRSGDALGGVILMGARLYNPNTGRFLSVDSVSGANPNAYVYPVDPIDTTDTNGNDPPCRCTASNRNWHVTLTFYTTPSPWKKVYRGSHWWSRALALLTTIEIIGSIKVTGVDVRFRNQEQQEMRCRDFRWEERYIIKSGQVQTRVHYSILYGVLHETSTLGWSTYWN